MKGTAHFVYSIIWLPSSYIAYPKQSFQKVEFRIIKGLFELSSNPNSPPLTTSNKSSRDNFKRPIKKKTVHLKRWQNLTTYYENKWGIHEYPAKKKN